MNDDRSSAADLNYVFGYGSFEKRTGVYSLVRYFPEFWNEPPSERANLLAMRRSLKVLSHEASHVFGLKHCIFYECTMNGSNSLEESDRSSMHECPVCHQKLLWGLKFDPQKRFKDLSRVYAKHGLTDESAWIEKRSEHWLLIK
jgi:archaemetzincin